MSATEESLLAALLELESAAARVKTAEPKPDLLGIFQRLDTLTAQLPPSTAPDLLHYLHRRSYQKALHFLQGSAGKIRAGHCAPR